MQPSLQKHPGPGPGPLPTLSLGSQERAGPGPPCTAPQLQTSALSPPLPLRLFSVSTSSWPLMVSRGREALHTSLPALSAPLSPAEEA